MQLSMSKWACSVALKLICATLAAPVQSADRATLIERMQVGGTNETDDWRHTVKVEDCTLTTYRWHLVEGTWVLWTSLQLDIGSFDLLKDPQKTDTYFIVIEGETADMAMVLFQANRVGAQLRHEKPFQRQQPRGMYDPSPRGDGTTHFYEYKSSAFYSHEGTDVSEKALMFSAAYNAYRMQYCTLAG